MRHGTYLNVILTANAVLLAGLLWTQVVQTPGIGLAQPAVAQLAVAQAPGGPMPGIGIPNAADQRQRILEALREIKGTVESTKKVLEAGRMRVEVTNLDQIKRVEVSNIDQLRGERK